MSKFLIKNLHMLKLVSFNPFTDYLLFAPTPTIAQHHPQLAFFDQPDHWNLSCNWLLLTITVTHYFMGIMHLHIYIFFFWGWDFCVACFLFWAMLIVYWWLCPELFNWYEVCFFLFVALFLLVLFWICCFFFNSPTPIYTKWGKE